MKTFVVITRPMVDVVNGKIVHGRSPEMTVELIAEGAGYLMVRHKGATPFVAEASDEIARLRATSWAKVKAAIA